MKTLGEFCYEKCSSISCCLNVNNAMSDHMSLSRVSGEDARMGATNEHVRNGVQGAVEPVGGAGKTL